MTNTLFREESFSLRFTKLSPDSASRVRDKLCEFNMTSRRADIVSLDLNETLNLDPIYSFVENGSLDPSTYSIWVSLITSSDHGGVSLPGYILELARRTGAGIDFSFVASLDEGEAQEA